MLRVYRTIDNLLQKRGYQGIDKDNRDFSNRESLTILTHKINDETDKIFVFFPSDEKVGIKPIRHYINLMTEENVNRSIIVYIDSITPFARREIENEVLRIECFNENELYIDITEHELVPEHILLNEQEKKELLDNYNIKEHQLPKIKLKTDPVARYYGLSKGDVVKIIRFSETAGKYINYRLAIN